MILGLWSLEEGGVSSWRLADPPSLSPATAALLVGTSRSLHRGAALSPTWLSGGGGGGGGGVMSWGSFWDLSHPSELAGAYMMSPPLAPVS